MRVPMALASAMVVAIAAEALAQADSPVPKAPDEQATALHDRANAYRAAQYAPALYGRGAIKMKKGDLAGGGADIASAKHFPQNIDVAMSRVGVRP